MKVLKFKTNINCGSCIRGVTPSLDAKPGIEKWEVDLKSVDRVLTVHADDGLSTEEVSHAVADAGFVAQAID